jgi:hypothetical protein
MTIFCTIDRIVSANSHTISTGFTPYDFDQQQLGQTIQPFLQLAHYFMWPGAESKMLDQLQEISLTMEAEVESTLINKL